MPDMGEKLLAKIFEHVDSRDKRRDAIDDLWNLCSAEERGWVIDLILEDNKTTIDINEVRRYQAEGLHSLVWTILIGAIWDNIKEVA